MKFNIESVQGDFERDPGGFPMLRCDSKGKLFDNQGRLCNEKGYLVDEEGNVVNPKGQIVFRKNLID